VSKNSIKIAVRVWLAAHERTQDWLAERCGITPAHLSYVLSGRDRASDRVRKAIKKITGVDVTPDSSDKALVSQ